MNAPKEDRMDWTLANIIRTHAAERGSRPMLTYGRRTISYGEMDAVSSRVAQGLLGEGIGSQDRVAFLDKNGPEYFEVLFGGAKVNAVNVAVNWRLAPEEIERTINDAQAKLLFVGADLLSQVDEVQAKLETVKRIIVLGDCGSATRATGRRDHRVRSSPPGALQMPDVDRFCQRAAEESVGQAAEASAARALLAGARAPHSLTVR